MHAWQEPPDVASPKNPSSHSSQKSPIVLFEQFMQTPVNGWQTDECPLHSQGTHGIDSLPFTASRLKPDLHKWHLSPVKLSLHRHSPVVESQGHDGLVPTSTQSQATEKNKRT